MQEFNKHWKKFSDTIESYLIRECAKGDINVSSINNEIASNIKRWQNPRNIEGLWLDNLKKKDLDKYHQFMNSFKILYLHCTNCHHFYYYCVSNGNVRMESYILPYSNYNAWSWLFDPSRTEQKV